MGSPIVDIYFQFLWKSVDKYNNIHNGVCMDIKRIYKKVW